jgi:hypothetical protein
LNQVVSPWIGGRFVLVCNTVKSVVYLGLDVFSLDIYYNATTVSNIKITGSSTSSMISYTWNDYQFSSPDFTYHYFLIDSENYRDVTNGAMFRFDSGNLRNLSLEAYAKGGLGRVLNCTICTHPNVMSAYPVTQSVPVPGTVTNHLIISYVCIYHVLISV